MSQRKVHGGRKGKRRKRQKLAGKVPTVAPENLPAQPGWWARITRALAAFG
jgi:hypothetical protein